MDVSCQFATSLDSPEHISVAEQLGYHRAWLHDTPAQSPDVWAMLALAAERTHRIGVAPGVLVPTLRHPMVNASGAATLAALSPGRVALAFGTGFNGTRALGAAPATWSLSKYVRPVRALLRGDTAQWDGAPLRMTHPDGNAPQRPIDLPVLVSALGPKGLAITREIADGLFTVNGETAHAHEFTWAALGIHGTVLGEDEPLDSPRVRGTAGPGNALAYHAAYEFAATPRLCPVDKPGSTPSPPTPTPNATSPFTTSTSPASVRRTAPPGTPAAGRRSPPPPSPEPPTASARHSAPTPGTASPKSSTSPPAPTSPANSNASSPSPAPYEPRSTA
ncbi:LLM class flavin-dependent oxidoreductase [Streptomyces sp. NPDC058272]|uniref:LLM class flavin-dependent oxidoreductase n=1 Tax=Streptomyces sp. NPDC058272 TaxID=3346415 RepID=UPI0036E4966A